MADFSSIEGYNVKDKTARDALFSYDYDNKVNLSSYLNGSVYTPTRNGFIIGFVESLNNVNSQMSIRVNNSTGTIVSWCCSQAGVRQSLCLPVQKGKSYYISGNIASGSNSLIYFA